MKKTVLLIGILLGVVMIFAACSGDDADDSAGSAEVVEAGDTVSVEYEGRLANGEVFDSSENGPALTFIAGSGMMIPGFDNAVLGMKLGEKKTEEIPPELAYGEAGIPGAVEGEYIIPPNETITFDIEVVKIEKPGQEDQ